MFFDIKNDIDKEISISEICDNENQLIMGYLTLEEFEKCYKIFGFSDVIIEECKLDRESIRSSIDVYDDYSYGLVTVIEPTAINEEVDKLAFFVKKNIFLVVRIKDNNGSTLEVFNIAKSKYKQNVTLEKVIYAYMEKLIHGDNRILESISKRITVLEENMMNNHIAYDINRQIFNFKKELLVFKDYYEQLIGIGEALTENENDLFDGIDLRYFKLFTDKVDRLSNYVSSLTEMTIHLREAYEAAIDLNLNRIMKIFTVITTIFFPLTLIVGWYGMNFTNMPELNWKYGYPCIIISSIVVVIVSIAYFKKKKFL